MRVGRERRGEQGAETGEREETRDYLESSFAVSPAVRHLVAPPASRLQLLDAELSELASDARRTQPSSRTVAPPAESQAADTASTTTTAAT